VLVNQGKRQEALSAYLRLVRLAPRDGLAYHALGLILRDLGRVDDAITAFSTAVRLTPDFPDAHLKLGMILRRAGRLEEAIGAYRHVITLCPDLAEAHNNLANVLRDLHRPDEAIEAYQQAIQLKPDDALAYMNLGGALAQAERFADAARAYESALRWQPDCAEAMSQRGVMLAHLACFDEAMQSHQRALAHAPHDPAAHEAMGATLLLRKDITSAVECFRRALALEPNRGASWNGLGLALRSLGTLHKAAECFARAVEEEPENASFHRNHVSVLHGSTLAGDKAGRLIALMHDPRRPLRQRVDAGFALGDMLDNAGRFDEAFQAYARANALFRDDCAGRGLSFDVLRLRGVVDQLVAHFTADFFAHRRSWGEHTETPVFVVGMPRTGTSLVEQIAASHPAVFGAGELPHIGGLARSLAGEGGQFTGEHWSARAVRDAARSYLEQLRSSAGGAHRIVDKMPGNVFLLGLIAVCFPAARVIFCRRDARDTCLSCYFQHFALPERHLYTYDLADCAAQLLEMERLMAHWRHALPLRMLEINYESLINRQEEQTRSLVDFLGLPWDGRCLDFHRTERPVHTASVWQVRQPLYSRSVGRWRRYASHLRPLLAALGDPIDAGQSLADAD
jgi:tetratricopeptide (TPR) repeat protein